MLMLDLWFPQARGLDARGPPIGIPKLSSTHPALSAGAKPPGVGKARAGPGRTGLGAMATRAPWKRDVLVEHGPHLDTTGGAETIP